MFDLQNDVVRRRPAWKTSAISLQHVLGVICTHESQK